MQWLLCKKYFFSLLIMVVYAESDIYSMPSMIPDLSRIHIQENQTLRITCVSESEMKFFHHSINSKDFDSSTININESEENGVYKIELRINQTVMYDDSGWYGCGHGKYDDTDVRWAYVHVEDDSYINYENISSYFSNAIADSIEQYIELEENDELSITCSSKAKMILMRYISPWKFCILSTEDKIKNNSNKTHTIKLQKIRKPISFSELFGCDYFEKYDDNFVTAKISQYQINGSYTIKFQKNQAVHGDTGWYGCSTIYRKDDLKRWTYVNIKPKRHFFVHLNAFKEIIVNANKSLIIPCQPKLAEYQVTLYANEIKINETYNVIFNHSLGFILKNIQLNDTGYYECRITSNDYTEKQGFNVKVTKSYSYEPTMKPDVSYIQLNEYETLELTCEHDQKIEFYYIPWSIDDFFSFNFPKLNENICKNKKSGIHTIKLQITAAFGNTGWYGCGSYNQSKTNIRWVYINVKAKPHILILEIDKIYDIQNTVEIYSEIETFPSSDITWSYNQSIIDKKSFDLNTLRYAFMMTTIDRFSNITSRNLELIVSNDYGYDNVVIPFILSSDKPDKFGIIDPSANKKVLIGEKLELTCIVAPFDRGFLEKPEFDYYNITKEIRILEYEDFQLSILSINPVKKSDEKIYYCETNNTIYEYKLKVYETEKPNFIHSNMNHRVSAFKIGEQSKLYCSVKGVPEPNITWYKDNVRINTTNLTRNDHVCNYEFLNNNQELQIGYFDEKCIGNYSCRAENFLDHIETYEKIVLDMIQQYDPTIKNTVLLGVTSAMIILIILLFRFFFKFQKEKNLRIQLMEGTSKLLNPELTVNEQVDLLSYNNKWEFPFDKLKLGKQLGSGEFGVVIKAEAHGIYGDNDKTITTVAVKIARKSTGITNIQALANELKIMIHLGAEHINVVNLLGACTKNIAAGELFVIVEYCHFGNLHDYLIEQRLKFINQINPLTGKINNALIGFKTLTALANVKNSNNNEINYSALSFSRSHSSDLSVINDKESIELSNDIALNDYSAQPDCQSNYRDDDYKKNLNLKPICTRDLFSWSLQVAKGMEYLSKKKVLHGDLAARNILLAENNTVKISDFGLAKNICNGIYQKKGNAPLPVKWMAIDSLEGGIFTSQSDVWSFGIVLWEFFSLAKTPYAGMNPKDCWLKVLEGYRMEKPEYATNEIYNIMFKCWLEDPTLRPTFTDLVNDIGYLYNNIDKKDNNDSNTPYVDIKKKLDDGTNNHYLIMNPTPDHLELSPSKNNYVGEPTININTVSSCVSMNSTNKNDGSDFSQNITG